MITAFLLVLIAAAQPATGTPPRLVESNGGFHLRTLDHAPEIDGREWIEVNVAAEPGTVRAPDRSFFVTLADAETEDTGDLTRYQAFVQRGRGPRVRIDRDRQFTAFVYITPDSRYIFTEPLYVIEVASWREYALHDALGIAPYIRIQAISGDGKRLLLARRDCAYDCRGERAEFEYCQLSIP